MSDIINPKIQSAYKGDLEAGYTKVSKAAQEAVESFATLVDKISQLKKLSSGTETKDKVSQLANEMNNSQIFLTKMLTEQLQALHGVINPNAVIEGQEEQQV